jgi:hypothetical protein
MKILRLSSILLLLSVFACNDSKTKEENKKLKTEIERLKQEKEKKDSPKFVWTVLYCKTATYSRNPLSGKESYSNIKDRIYWSEITEFSNFNENLKYRLQDELENQIRSNLQEALYSVQDRKTYVFDSYKEASEFKFKKVNQ